MRTAGLALLLLLLGVGAGWATGALATRAPQAGEAVDLTSVVPEVAARPAAAGAARQAGGREDGKPAAASDPLATKRPYETNEPKSGARPTRGGSAAAPDKDADKDADRGAAAPTDDEAPPGLPLVPERASVAAAVEGDATLLRRGPQHFARIHLAEAGVDSLTIRRGRLERDGPARYKPFAAAAKVGSLRGDAPRVELLHLGYDAGGRVHLAHIRAAGGAEGIVALRMDGRALRLEQRASDVPARPPDIDPFFLPETRELADPPATAAPPEAIDPPDEHGHAEDAPAPAAPGQPNGDEWQN